MARPHKQTVDYFPHYSNASGGKTLYILESKFGNNGYAFWFKLLEILANSEGHFYDARNPVAWEFLQAKTHVDGETANQIMNLLVSLEAIDSELWKKRIIWSQNLVDNITDAYRNRTTDVPLKPSINGKEPLYIGVTSVENGVPDVRNPQTKVYKNKLDKSIYIAPDWIDKETWGAFLEMRKNKKAVPTEKAKELLIKELDKLRSAGNDPNEVLKQSIRSNWTDVYPLKEKLGGKNRGHNTARGLPKTYRSPEEIYGGHDA